MSTKLTLHIPEPLAERLRERSRREGLSLNETAMQVLSRGIAEQDLNEEWRSLGKLVEVPPRRRFNAAEFAHLRDGLKADAQGYMQELDWVRRPN